MSTFHVRVEGKEYNAVKNSHSQIGVESAPTSSPKTPTHSRISDEFGVVNYCWKLNLGAMKVNI